MKSFTPLSGLTAIVFLLAANQGCARKQTEDPQRILQRMIQASSDTNYTGIKSFEQKVGNQFFRFRMKVSRQGANLTRLEMLDPAPKRGEIIIKRGGQSWRLGPTEDDAVHYKQFGSHRTMDIRNLPLLLANYRLYYMGTETIAQRPTHIIRISSRTHPNIQRLIWVDQQSFLPLKSEESCTASPGQCVKRFLFEQIQFHHRLSADLFRVPMGIGGRSAFPPPQREAIRMSEARRLAKFLLYLPTQLPPGFVMEHIRWVPRQSSGFLHFQYSDGLRAISLFEEDSESFPAAAIQEPPGTSNRIYRLNDGTMTILHRHWDKTYATIVGDTEADELIKMISSMQPSGDAQLR